LILKDGLLLCFGLSQAAPFGAGAGIRPRKNKKRQLSCRAPNRPQDYLSRILQESTPLRQEVFEVFVIY
jgi:hypothetical protein